MSKKVPWLIVGVLGCLAVCLCLTLVGGILFFGASVGSTTLLGQLVGMPSPTFVPLPTVTFAPSPTVVSTPLPKVTSAPLPTATSVPTSSATRSASTSASLATVTPTRQPTVATRASSSSSSANCASLPALAPGILFNDDFGSRTVSECYGWLLTPGQNVDYGWAQNKYTISVYQTDYLGFDWPNGKYSDFAAEIEAQPITDALTDFGIAFRITGNKETRGYYMFAVTSDGDYYVQGKMDGDWLDDDVVASTASAAIKQGKNKNTVGVIARGSAFSLYINRKLVKTFTDTRLTSDGAVGIFAGSNDENTAVVFSRLTIMTPDKALAEWK